MKVYCTTHNFKGFYKEVGFLFHKDRYDSKNKEYIITIGLYWWAIEITMEVKKK